MQRSEVIRARGGGFNMPSTDQRDDLMQRWEEFKRHNQVAPGEETRLFAYWLLDVTHLAVDQETHRRQIEQLKLELGGERQLLMIVGEIERGKVDITFAKGAGRDFVGAGVMQPNMLPRTVAKGDYLLLTISRPRCRVCGCTNERACVGGCSWVEPNLCSKHPSQMRRKWRRV